MNKNTIFISIFVVIAIIVGIILLNMPARMSEPSPESFIEPRDTDASQSASFEEKELIDLIEGEDTTISIEADLEEIQIDDLEAEFEEIDKDLNSL